MIERRAPERWLRPGRHPALAYHPCLVQRDISAVQVRAEERRVEPVWCPATGGGRFVRVSKSHRLIPQRSENLLLSEQALAVGFEHEDGLSESAPDRTRNFVPGGRLDG
jgi:hypothetical protein